MPRLAGAAAVVVIVAVAFNIAIHSLERSPPVQPEYQVKKTSLFSPAPAKVVPEPREVPVQGILSIEEKRPLIEAALRSFFQATTIEGKLAFSRDPDRVRPLMQQYYAASRIQPRQVSGLGNCQSVSEKGHRLGYIQVRFSPGEPLSIIVEEDAEGRFRADWESLVLYGEMTWQDFLSQKPQTPTLLRVLASHLPVPISDQREWLEITVPGQARRLKAYFDRKDPQLQPLVEQLQLGSWKNVPLTLRVCYSEPKLNADTVQIVSSEGKGWLILTDRRS
ncbi:hypothetical protein [Prosthecobacter fusiformis]|nr:hypothetical protein [Prosthecobacter fusiformis]